MSYSTFRKYWPTAEIRPTNVLLRAYNQQTIPIEVISIVGVQHKNKEITGGLYIICGKNAKCNNSCYYENEFSSAIDSLEKGAYSVFTVNLYDN